MPLTDGQLSLVVSIVTAVLALIGVITAAVLALRGKQVEAGPKEVETVNKQEGEIRTELREENVTLKAEVRELKIQNRNQETLIVELTKQNKELSEQNKILLEERTSHRAIIKELKDDVVRLNSEVTQLKRLQADRQDAKFKRGTDD